MRLVSFVPADGRVRCGVVLNEVVVDLEAAAPLAIAEPAGLRWDMLSLLQGDQDEVNLDSAADIAAAVLDMLGNDDMLAGAAAPALEGNGAHDQGSTGNLLIGGVEMLLPLEQVRLLAPLPRPASLRLFDAFEQHARFAFELGEQPFPREWYQFPAFAFGNHGAIYGPDEAVPMSRSSAFDYELEVGCVIGRTGVDIDINEANQYIAGYTIVNDWSARDVQATEDAIGLGPAKAKDFATSLGPWLVTPDELEIYADDDGRLLLTMIARVNRIERARANFTTIHYTFAEMIAHASRDAVLYPGDVLCSGAVGGGSLLEQTRGYGPWLAAGDVVELEITGLGMLRNQVY